MIERLDTVDTDTQPRLARVWLGVSYPRVAATNVSGRGPWYAWGGVSGSEPARGLEHGWGVRAGQRNRGAEHATGVDGVDADITPGGVILALGFVNGACPRAWSTGMGTD